MKVYVAGPMTGFENFNYPAFNRAAEQLRDRDLIAFNPAAGLEAPNEDLPWEEYIRRALAMVIRANGLATLDGWERSRGARLEVQVALAIGIVVKPLSWWLTA